MMRIPAGRSWRTAALVLLLCASSRILPAVSPGSTAAPFLKIGVDAHACAMGEAFTAVIGNASALHWNPGAGDFLEKNQVLFMHNLWAEDVYMDYLALAVPMAGWGTPMVSAAYLWMPSLEVNDDLGQPTGESWKVYDLAVSLGWSKRFSAAGAGGAALKIIHRQLGGYTALGVSLDAGLLWRDVLPDVNLGASVQNVGPDMKFIDLQEKLPMTLRLGSWWKCWSDPENHVALTVDAVTAVDHDPYPAAGFEYSFRNIVSLRGGWIGRSDLQAFSAGFGFRDVQENYTTGFDYALTSQSTNQSALGYVHRISLMYSF